jgi:hypothetical protein
MTTVGLYAIGTSTPLESNKSLVRNRVSAGPAAWMTAWSRQGGEGWRWHVPVGSRIAMRLVPVVERRDGQMARAMVFDMGRSVSTLSRYRRRLTRHPADSADTPQLMPETFGSAVRHDTVCDRFRKAPHHHVDAPGRCRGAGRRRHALHRRDLRVQGTTAQALQRHHDRWCWRRLSQWGAGPLGVCLHGCRHLLRLQGTPLVWRHRPRLAPPYGMGRHAPLVWASHCAFRPNLLRGMCHL